MQQNFQSDAQEGFKTMKNNLQRTIDAQELNAKLKRRKLGNISFIGELCKMNLISTNIIHDCVWQLLVEQPEDGIGIFTWKTICDDDEIEVLCKLFMTVGHKLVVDDSKRYRKNLSLVFNRLRELSSDKSLNSRMRFALREVVENHENGWREKK